MPMWGFVALYYFNVLWSVFVLGILFAWIGALKDGTQTMSKDGGFLAAWVVIMYINVDGLIHLIGMMTTGRQ